MDESFQLYSSMSPKITQPKKHVRKGPTVLALKKHFRRSSICDNAIRTVPNDSLIIVEKSSTEASDTNSQPSVTKAKNPIIVISDSDLSDDNKTKDISPLKKKAEVNINKKNIDGCVLSKTKQDDIEKWINNIITIEDSICDANNATKFSEVSTIAGNEDMFSQKTDVAINSTFMNSKKTRFDELFKSKSIQPVRYKSRNSFIKYTSFDTSVEESFEIPDKKIKDEVNDNKFNFKENNLNIIEASFEEPSKNDKNSIANETSCNKTTDLSNLNEDDGSDKENFLHKTLDKLCLEDSSNLKLNRKSTKKLKRPSESNSVKNNLSNIKDNDLSESDENDENITECSKILDNLYGNSWRKNQETILPKSEPRIKKPLECDKFVAPISERKPKKSLLYKNPYVDNEKTKSKKLLRTLQTARMKANMESPWTNSLKKLCDSDTPSENDEQITKLCKTKLNFDNDDDCNSLDGNNKIPQHFSTEESKLNNVKNKQDSRSSSSNSDVSDLGISLEEKIRNNINNFKDPPKRNKKVIKSSTTNKKQTRKEQENDKCSSGSSSNSRYFSDKDSLEDRIKKKTKGSEKTSNVKTVTTRKEQENDKCSSSSSSNGIYFSDRDSLEDRIKKKTNGLEKISIVKTVKDSTESNKKKNDDKSITKKNIKKDINLVAPLESRTRKKAYKKVIDSDTDTSSNDWTPIKKDKNNKIIKNLEPGKLLDGSYSFLASLSGSVPLSVCDPSARIFRNNFKQYRDKLVSKLFDMYNSSVFDNVMPQDFEIQWNDRMRGTAGFCYCKKITRKTGVIERSARIALSSKVLDSADRLRDTLIHEMCHAATWLVNHVSDGHGPYWKSWADKAMKTFPELPPIKRCHEYAINTKYTYKCTGCGYSIGRHSKSLDIERKRCGYCYGVFEVLVNKTNKKGETKSVPATPKKEATGFALFVKENYATYKTHQLKHADVMKLLGHKFSELKVDINK